MVNAIEINQLQFSWPRRKQVSLDIPKWQLASGEHCFLEGASGSGKTTLLNILAGIFTPQQGDVKLLDTNLQSLKPHQKDRFRADHLGIIFQQFNLLPYLNVEQNILLPIQFSSSRQAREPLLAERLQHLLAQLHLPESLIHEKAGRLSIGQQQRVAMARALIGQPEIILADEPTSALDYNNRDRFMQELLQSATDFKSTVVFVSHDQSLAQYFSRHVYLENLNQVATS